MASVHAVLPVFAPTLPFRQVLVVGLGNTLLADDGVGVHAVIGSRPTWRNLEEPLGTIRLLRQEALGHYIRPGSRMSAHEAGLIELLTLGQLDGWVPPRLALLAIQPQRIDWDDQLSEPVVRALPAAYHTAIATVLYWRATA